jgi:hypothetical protein
MRLRTAGYRCSGAEPSLSAQFPFDLLKFFFRHTRLPRLGNPKRQTGQPETLAKVVGRPLGTHRELIEPASMNLNQAAYLTGSC